MAATPRAAHFIGFIRLRGPSHADRRPPRGFAARDFQGTND